MTDAEIQGWKDIITTNTVTAIALVKLLTQKGLLTDAELEAAIRETKQELTAKKPR